MTPKFSGLCDWGDDEGECWGRTLIVEEDDLYLVSCMK